MRRRVRHLFPVTALPAVTALLAVTSCCCGPGPVNGPASVPSADTLIAELRGHQAQLHSLRGATKMDYISPEGRTKVTVNLAVARPGRLRLEAENPISGHTEGTLVTDGRTFALLDVRANRFLRGPALACNVARMTRIAMPPDDVALILLGSAPLLPHERAEVGYVSAGGGREVLTLHLRGGARERIAVSRRTRDVVEAELQGADGRPIWRLAHEDFRSVGSVRLPRKTKFAEPRGKSDILIRYKDVEANAAIPDTVFTLAPPPGMVVNVVGCEDPPSETPPASQSAP
jgi:outer membrane lipoprotein-sorting protein